MDDILKDDRFAHIVKDARFRRIPKNQRKVKIDQRFKAMFNDKKFKLKYSVDKRGRPVHQTTSENLKKFYELSESESSEDDDCEESDKYEGVSYPKKEKREDNSQSSKNKQVSDLELKKKKRKVSKDKLQQKEKRNIKDRLSERGPGRKGNDSLDVSEDSDDVYEDSEEEEERLKEKKNLGLKTGTGKLKEKEQKDQKKQVVAQEKRQAFAIVIESKAKQEDQVWTHESDESSTTDEEEEWKKKGQSKNKKVVQSYPKKEKGRKLELASVYKRDGHSYSSEELEDDDDEEKDDKSGLDLARGEGNMETSSEEEEESEDERDREREEGGKCPDFATGEINVEKDEETKDKDGEEAEEDIEHDWGELDKNVPQVEELGCRLAVCNMDWDRIKAQDIYVLLNSFKPANGVIKSVKVYPSEYGLKRMKEEQEQGPQGLAGTKVNVAEEEQDAEDAGGSSYHTEKLRQYQLNRLRYYYAVADCDSIATANQIYGECDGMEYESSSARLDLRFIPDEMEFNETPTSVCTNMPDASSYKPSLFFTTALCQSKVDLTWDETDRDRQQRITQQFQEKEIQEDNLLSYLASSSEEEESDVEDNDQAAPDSGLMVESDEEEEENEDTQIQKYKSLLLGLEEQDKKKKDKDLQMEITWEPGLRGATEGMVKKKKESKNKTVWDEYLQKKKEKKKKKTKAGRSSKEKVDIDLEQKSDEAAFSDDELPEGVDLNDPFFASELSNEANDKKCNKKNKKKKKKRSAKTTETADTEGNKQSEAELSLLLMGGEDNKKHFNLDNLVTDDTKKRKKKKKKVKDGNKSVEDDFKLNVADPRFGALFESHLYNIDPSAPEFKKTKAMDELIEEKLKRRKDGKTNKKKLQVESESSQSSEVRTSCDLKRKVTNVDDNEPKSKKQLSNVDSPREQSLQSLVKSVKSKTQQFHSKKKR